MIFIMSISVISVIGADVEFEMITKTLVNDIYPTQTAKFEITLLNPLDTEDEFKINLGPAAKWSFSADPVSYLSGITLDAGEEVTFYVTIKASGDGLSYGMQSFPLIIKSKISDISKEETLQLLLRNPTPPTKTYMPSVSFNVDVPDKIDPRQDVELKIHLINKNPLNIKELVISVRSELYNMDRIVALEPLGNKIETFKIDYADDLEPTDDIITVKIKTGDVEFTPSSKYVSIVPYKELIEDKVIEKSFLKKTRNYKYTNDGNVADTQKVKVKSSLLLGLFTKTTPKASIIKDNEGRFYFWEFELMPGEEKTVQVTRNYRPLVYAIILIIIGTIAYFLFRSPIVLRKEAKVLKVEDEGISHLKVLVHVKNRANKAIDEVKLIDRVPQIANLDHGFDVGTLHPDKVIRHEHKGTILKWEIKTLEPYEERIISYAIKSKLNIIGGLGLPAAIIKFKGTGKKLKKCFSNTITAK
ncbi:hypothetical protein HN695_02850 [Candidatus Woesearchaeota archaeon]|nr:hypothetical protein [Candidatus Woesearchaeota archaeon]MBT5272129.1 hypothetical protein [Candidatus Woesearchaeota archaeon]MBT6040932.1 hypothetical protein [Candidatus Woesearchaeota archaeon]MBT6336266.1 hypothetical protein [Candidatus Woesearchaeota archaeon]MBT7927249.1 hypothetical protein [Candidatus Woesearchaeota archaeon]